jgi:hypothetical protein
VSISQADIFRSSPQNVPGRVFVILIPNYGMEDEVEQRILKRLCRSLSRSLEVPRNARSQWLTPVILATQEAEIRRIVLQNK